MELFIETLTGTCFELQVSPFETVVSVKAKIQRLEGIPVSQQHLIWKSVELEDKCSLNEYNISEGCTLKLVLAMRGGPINTRRVPLEDSIREMSEHMDPLREEMWDKSPSNKPVTFLVHREDNRLNFFRVVDRGDGTLTPLSESPSGGSVYNLYPEDDDEACPSVQQLKENSITMNKMKLLKSKMKNMNLNKKLKPRPPVVPRASSNMTTVRHKFRVRVLPHIGESCLPLGKPHSPECSHSTLTAASRTIPTITSDCLTEDDTWNTSVLAPPLNSFGLPPKISRVELENTRPCKNTLLPPISPLPKKDMLTTEKDTIFNQNINVFSAEEKTRPIADSFALVTEGGPSEQYGDLYNLGKAKPDFGSAEGRKESTTTETRRKALSTALNSEAMESGVINNGELSTPRNKFVSPIHFPAQISRNSFSDSHHQPRCFEFGSLRPTASHSLFRSLEIHNMDDPSFSRTTRFRGVKVDAPGNRSDVSKMEARDMTELANRASKEPVGTLKNLEFFASLARGTSRDSFQRSSNPDTLQPSAVAHSTSQQYAQEETFKRMESFNDNADLFMRPHGVSINNAATRKVIAEAPYILPPVKSTLCIKKKTTKHCFFCRKKTGLATSFECRCGNNFCATHRYAETHNCSYDYKTAGRRYLEEANPVITASKLPKI
ncbi:AN1-type zinc finger protein 4 [Spea bombifrons]|uniref:AN1-type zinc finger protein 4 n=1 Tax=Spea bombifrons TaxID=233779 RepID=UPI00234B9C54|nr:AN1-type zinc finger protein 4 [Spea bombifrons]